MHFFPDRATEEVDPKYPAPSDKPANVDMMMLLSPLIFCQ
jgi:hypothetical protein